jgi:hypothetical protein
VELWKFPDKVNNCETVRGHQIELPAAIGFRPTGRAEQYPASEDLPADFLRKSVKAKRKAGFRYDAKTAFQICRAIRRAKAPTASERPAWHVHANAAERA